MNSTTSLAARVHAFLADRGETRHWTGSLDDPEHHALFGTERRGEIALTIDRLDDGTFTVEHRRHYGPDVTLTLAEIQHQSERDDEPYDDDREGNEFLVGYGCDYYRSFPRTEASIAVIRNPVTGRSYDLLACKLEDVRDLAARHQGYADWQEMRAFALPDDFETDWIVEWQSGSPEEMVRSAIVRLTAEKETLTDQFLAEMADDSGQKFRDKQADLFDFGWAKRDPDAYSARKAECDELRRLQVASKERSSQTFDRMKEIDWLLNMYRDAEKETAAA